LTDPTISVVVPTFERCEACRRAVSSILTQTFEPLEVFVCDDGSLDGTDALFLQWEKQEPRLRYLRLNAHTGSPAMARNAGIRAARGEWIAFLDDDDRWLPQKLELQLPALCSGEVDVVAANARLGSGMLYLPSGKVPEQPSRRDVLSTNPIIMSTAIVRHSVLLEAGGFPEQRRWAGIEDYLLWITLVERGARLRVLDQPLVEYASHGEDRLSRRRLRLQVEIIRHLASQWLRKPLDTALLRGTMVNTGRMVKLALKAGLRPAV
jgi:teichuronic acid biosynthesis glycosyltransferase TuaG